MILRRLVVGFSLSMIVAACTSAPTPTDTAPAFPSPEATGSPATLNPVPIHPTPSPSSVPTLPEPTAGPSESPTPAGTPQSGDISAYQVYLNDGGVWAPDGRHLLLAVQTDRSGAYENWVVSSDGQVIAKLQGESASWFDAQTVEEGHFPGDNYSTAPMPRVDLDTLDGTTLSSLAGDYGMLDLGPGHVAVTPPHGEGEYKSFQIWDGHSLSETISGEPTEWSPDGHWLVVFHLRSGNSGRYSIGSMSVLNSHTLVNVPVRGWVVSETSQMTFSPNSHYVAIGAGNYTTTIGGTIIVNLADGSVATLPPDTDPRGWIGPNTLLLEGTGLSGTWTPEAGFSATTSDEPRGLIAQNGSSVFWGDSASQ